MQRVSPWLDLLTECILSISEPPSQNRSTKEWLDQTAEIIAHQLGSGCGVALIRVVLGSRLAPWSRSKHAVCCGAAERNEEWRRRYTSAVVASGLTPEDFITARRPNASSSGGLAERNSGLRLRKLSDLLVKQHNIASFLHCSSLIPNHSGVEPGALVLDAWTMNQESMAAIPPKPVFKNICRAVAALLARIEQQTAEENKNSVMTRLTPAQRKVAVFLVQGLSERQIATKLERSPHTIHQHVKAIYTELSVRTRAEFMARCVPVINTNFPNHVAP